MILKKCKNCNVEFETSRSDKQHCSEKCFSEYRSRPEILAETISKRKASNIKKYGVDNAAKSYIVKQTAKNTCLERYGVESPTQNKDIREKQLFTLYKNYGVTNPQLNDALKHKQQDTLYKNYGVIIPLKSDIIKNVVRQTCLDLYGVDNVAKTEDVKNKIISTNLEKYGVKYISQHLEFKEKQIRSRLISHYNFLITNAKFINVIPLFSEDEYSGNIEYDKKYPFKCKKCNFEFDDTLVSGNIPRCFICNPINKTLSENEVFEFIKSILPVNTSIISGDRKILGGLELDIYIPDFKIAIEYNGLFWHSEIGGKKYKNYHLNKTNKCNELGIHLIHIFEDEWLYKNEIVKSKLRTILQQNHSIVPIYARKCEIRELDSDICNNFLNLNHIQGCDKSSIRLGAYYNNELVSIMTFGSFRIALGSTHKSNSWEMYRFCSSIDKRIIGVGGKLLSYFIKTYMPEHIISYADARWSSNVKNVYKSLGFKFIKQTSPNYWYLMKNRNVRIYRFNFQKHLLKNMLKLFNPEMTEWQNMQLNGYDRIWDCGNFKYEWSKK